jgi:pentatricopeptide repeat-containing protein PET309
MGISYPTLAATENFEAKVRELYKFLENDPERLDQRTALVDSFLKHIVRHSLDLFRPSDVIFMLDRARDPLSYERYIILNAEQGRNRLASDLYKKYRVLPNKVRVAESVLRIMIDIFFPHNVHGMELLLEDWYRDYGRLNERAYHKFMAFYAGRGDIKSIMRLGKEYSRHYDVKVEEDPKWVANLMHAHAVRGDPEAARHVMDRAVERSGEPPELKQWNILLNAYAKAGDYEGAIGLFAHICNEYEVDDYTFATMMHMAGFRGDLQFTLELFQLAKERNVEPNVAMMRALTEAYCQNDRHAEAEKLCVQLTKKREIAGDYTFLWNGLLRHNARRRDLTTVNRLLELMSSLGIAYNQETYSQLILALLYARQSHHAMHLLRVAHREGVFEPTADHYVMLMAAFINSGEPHMALKTNELMAQMNFPESAMRMTKVIDALGRWQQFPSSKRRGLRGQYFLQRILRDFYEVMKREEQGAPDDVRSVVGLYSKVIFILTQMREFATVQQIVQLHNSRYPSRGTEETIPLKLLHSVMLADFYEKKYDRVMQTWELILERSSERYQPASAYLGTEAPTEPRKPVVYAQRFRLCNPLKTMQRLYLQTEDPEGLMNLVSTVRERGFDLDSKNWNYHVQALARLKQWRQAFTVCEEVLMPQWMGWYSVRAEAKEKNQLPLELRRAGTNPARPRPIAHTLLILAKEYMDLEQMALWSHEANREFKFITENCPKTVHAVTSMVRSGSPLEAEILGEERREESDGMDTDLDGRWYAEKVQGRETEELRVQGGRRPGKLVRQATPKWARSARTKEREENVPYDDVWTQGGYLNVGDPAAQKKKGKQAELTEEDILRGLKGEGEKQSG